MRDAKDVDEKALREAIGAINGTKVLKEKIEIKGKTVDDMMNDLCAAVESLEEADANKLPEKAINMYNNLIEDEVEEAPVEAVEEEVVEEEVVEESDEAVVEEEEVVEESVDEVEEAEAEVEVEDEVVEDVVEEVEKKKEKAPKPAVDKVKKKEAAKENAKKDIKTTSTTSSRNELFLQAITKKPLTMKEVKVLPWNKTHGTFYSFFKTLVAGGKGKKTEDGKFAVINK